MPELNRNTFFTRYGGVIWILLAAVLSAGLAVGLARYAIPTLLLRIEPSRITPTLLQTLNLRLWTVILTAVLLTALAIWKIIRPEWRLSPVRMGLGLIGLSILLRWATPDMAFNSIVRPDAIHFSVTAQQLVSHGTVLIPTGGALLPARTLPGPSFLMTLTQWINPSHPGYSVLAVWLCSVLSLWLAFSLARRLYGDAAGWWAALLLALSPALAWYTRQIMSEIPWGLLTLASCALLAYGTKRPGRMLMAGILAGCGLLIKSSHLLVMIGMVLGLVMVHFRRTAIRPSAWFALIIGLAMGAFPALLYNRLVLGDWFNTAYHIYWPGWASATTALNIKYLWSPPLINGTLGNIPYYALALIGLDPRPERMILLPGAILLLGYLLAKARRHTADASSTETFAFQWAAISVGVVYGTACLLYSFQEPRFFLPIVPLCFVALAGPLARGWSTQRWASSSVALLGPVALVALIGLGLAIIKVETFFHRTPERVILHQLAETAAHYDLLVSDEDPVLLTTFGVWTDATQLSPLLLPGELWFPENPAQLFTEKGVAVEPFTGTINRVTLALDQGLSVAAYIRRPHTRPAAWTAFTNAFTLTPLASETLTGLYEIRSRLVGLPPSIDAEVPVPPTTASVAHIVEPKPGAEQAEPVFLLGAVEPEPAIARERSMPPHPVTLDPFALASEETDHASFVAFLNESWAEERIEIDRNESDRVVYWTGASTTGRWALCMLRADDPHSGLRYEPDQAAPFYPTTNGSVAMARQPMTYVSWYGATAYCNWRSRSEGLPEAYLFSTNGSDTVERVMNAGYRLPTEAEWEWAATWDGERKRRYVWGDDWDPAQANFAASPRSDYSKDEPFTIAVDRDPPWTPIEAKRSPYRHLAGNVWEWCDDWFSDYTATPATNPVGPAVGEIKILRGGSYRTHKESGWAAFRGIAPPEMMTSDIGFRILRPVP